MKNKISKIQYVLLLISIPTPLWAYHNQTSGFDLLVGIIIVLIFGALFKFFGYLLIMLLSNKWTWIISAFILVCIIIASIDNHTKIAEPVNTPTFNYQQSPKSNNDLYNNQSNQINSVQNIPKKKQRIEEYTTICPLCSGSGTINCQYCGGSGYVSTKCTWCDGKGGQGKIKCVYCYGIGYTSDVLTGALSVCFSCNGTGYRDDVCTRCSGSGETTHLCDHCSVIKDSKVSCTTCNGTGIIKCTKIVDYYE